MEVTEEVRIDVIRNDVSQASFVGRAAELALIASSIEASATHRSRVVWVEGEAGSGKTSLVQHALRSLPPGFQLVRAQADELATDVPFYVTAQLGSSTGDRSVMVAMDLLESWARLQDRGPVVILIEDLHWADTGSRQALLTACRRLDEDRVVVIMTSRPGDDDGWDRFYLDERRCDRLSLAALDVGDVATLAALSGMTLTHAEAERLHSHTRGHPLYVRTLLSELTLAQLQRPDVDLPAPRSLASTTIGRLAQLPVEGRDLAAAMAVVNQRLPLQLIGRIAGATRLTAAFEHLLATGFVDWEPNDPDAPVEFAHPLFRLAVYRDLSPTARQRLHRAAARVLPASAALFHRVAAADGSDEELADELDGTARRELGSGAFAAASRHLLSASSLSEDRDQAEQRVIGAAWVLLEGGETAQASGLRDRVEACRDSPPRNLTLGLIDWELGDAASAERLLRRATEGYQMLFDVPVGTRARSELSIVYTTQGRAGEAVREAEMALAEAGPETPTERLAWIGLAMAEGMLRGAPAGLTRLRRRLPEPAAQVTGSKADLLVTRGALGFYAGQTAVAIEDLRSVLRLARAGSVAQQISRSHLFLASLLVNTGDWDEALLHGRISQSIVADDRQVWMVAQVHALLGTILAYRDEGTAADDHMRQAIDAVASYDSLEAALTVRVAEASVARARQAPHRVVEILAPLPGIIPMLGDLPWWPALVTALIEIGEVDRAELSITELAVAADARGLEFRGRLAGLQARLAAARNEPAHAAERFDQSVAFLGPDDPLLDRASVHQAYGRFLLARGDRRHAVTQLRLAHGLLADAGAQAFLTQVGVDLAASGIRLAGVVAGSALALTDRERDVAQLVAKGLTNPEVAAELYVSRKAVEYHLSNIYGKLGITSRRELRRAAF